MTGISSSIALPHYEMQRQPEPELMDLPDEVAAYALADFGEVNARFVDRLLELTAGIDAADAIDLGCGPGDITRRVALARPGWRVTAADASAPMLDWAAGVFARAGVVDRVSCRLVDAKRVDLPDASFDILFSNSLLHHLTDAVAVWREVRRLARPGGFIFFRDLYRPTDADAARTIVDRHAGAESDLLREEFYRSLLSAYSPAEIREQLAAADLGHLAVQTVTDRHVDIVGRR
jgi:ubiquinone/menaquinone biosynthesis C-methylase UbiE